MRNGNTMIQGTKGILTMLTGLLAYMVDAVTELVIALVVLMFIDYITGMISGFIQKKWNSATGLKGAVKKAGFILLVMIAVLTDYVIMHLGEKIGLSLGFVGIFTLAVTCWLISTELLSITENLGKIGVPIPGFLRMAFTKLKDVAENIGKENAEKIVNNKEAKKE